MKITLTDDWNKAGIYFQNLAVKLFPAYSARIWEDGEFILEKLQKHIDSQDLGWTPLAERTVALKGGDTTILVDTGQLRNGLTVRRVKSSATGSTIFIGASPWKKHAGGMSMSDLMIWLEYGTDKLPPRPLIAPTYQEIQGIIQQNWVSLMKELLKG